MNSYFANGLLELQFVSPEAELLLHCARIQLEPERAERMRQLLGRELQWELLSRLAQRNGLSPLLFFHLHRLTAGSMSTQWLEKLRDYYLKNKALNILMTGELIRLLELFRAEGVQALPYKGTALAVDLYGEIALRQVCDLDILVREPDVWKATEILEREGFEPHFNIPQEKQSAFVRLGYVRLFRRDEGRTIVELHWRTAPRFFGVPFRVDGLWGRARTIRLLGSNVLVPTAADLLLMLSIHAAKDCWEKLEWVSAIAELLKTNPDLNLNAVHEEARRLHCEMALSLALFLALDLLEAPLQESWSSYLRSSKKITTIGGRIANRFFVDHDDRQTVFGRMAFHLRSKDSLMDQIRYCTRLALTTTPVDWAMLELPQPLSFLYLPLRALRLAKRYGS